MGSGASQLGTALSGSSDEDLRRCAQELSAEEMDLMRRALACMESKAPEKGLNMPDVPEALKELWPSLGERFGPYDFLFAEDPTEAIRAKLGADPFVDPDFQSLKRAPHRAYRMGDDPGAQCVWPETGPRLHHVRQVTMGDCEFMAAFAAMSMYPESLKEIFHTVKDGQKDPNHLYTFKVTYKGREGYLVMDDLVPGAPGCPEGAYPSHGTIWVSLLEKFTAKLSDQDYDLLQGHKGRNEAGLELRTGMDVACLFLGGHTLCVSPSKSRDVRFCEVVEFLLQEPKTIVTCVAEGGSGLVDVHAYSVGGMYTVGDVQLVKLQNPWGKGEWTGDWSDKSALWEEHPEVAEAVDFQKRDEGTFFMSRADLVKHFSTFLYNRRTALRDTSDDALDEQTEWLGEYSDGDVTSCIKKVPGDENAIYMDHKEFGSIDLRRSKYKHELAWKEPFGPATAVLLKKGDQVLGYSSGVGDFNWYVGPLKEDATAGELEVKMRDFEVHPRAWEPDEKPMHWRGTWTTGEEDDTFTITGETFETLSLQFTNGKTYSLVPVMFQQTAVLVPHDYTVTLNINKVQRFRRHIQFSQYDGNDKIYKHKGGLSYWTKEDEQ